MQKIIIAVVLTLVLSACNDSSSVGDAPSDTAKHAIAAVSNATSPMQFAVTRPADVVSRSGEAPVLAAKSSKAILATSAASVSSVPSYTASSGVLSAGNLIVTSASGSNTCYNTTFSTAATSPSIVIQLSSATQTSCPATSNSLYDGTTLTLNEMNYVSSGAAVCYDVTLTGGTATSYAFTVTSVNPTTCETGQTAIDVTKLPLGDTRLTTTTPAVGYLYACSAGSSGAGGASSKGPWFNADGTTWNLNAKDIVSGAVSWVSSFTTSLSSSSKAINGNGLPSHTTGTYPIPKTDAIHQYDGNPNSIATQTINWGLPGNPQVAAKPSCTPQGAIGVLLTGVRLYNAVDGESRDAKAWEGQDSCQGHPDISGTYHYHSVSTCATKGDVAGSHSQLVGYAADGFAIFGNQGEDGVALTNANLDECHGHTHAITINGKTIVQYHYHATQEYPYSVGCFRGTAVTVH